eukprot:2988048-Amphidinium_carterae.1
MAHYAMHKMSLLLPGGHSHCSRPRQEVAMHAWPNYVEGRKVYDYPSGLAVLVCKPPIQCRAGAANKPRGNLHMHE